MTSRAQSSPSIDNISTANQVNEEDEERPTHTSEIGTLKKLPNHGTAWLGSSSGVYFVNTVRRAFSAAFASSQAVPASEDILTGEDAEGRNYNGPAFEGPATTDTFPNLFATSLGRLPDRKIAMELTMSYFKAWHPIFPMLHGPSFLKDMELLYSAQRPTPPAFSGSRPTKTPDSTSPVDVRKIVTFQLIINIASLDRTDIQLPNESRIRSTADVTRVAGSLALDHDIATLQTLLAAQLYLVATLAIRAASTVGGIIVKTIYHAGLHRCPLRYAQLSEADCDIRKRIFWTAYALDRHCSLSLGDPNTIQDNDIDVCLSGRELHKAVARDLLSHPEHEISLHFSDASQRTGGLGSGPVHDDPRVNANASPEAREKSLREAALISYVHWSRLTGRIIEIFHKSINHRFPKHEQIVYLTSDIETWWNDLPSFLTGDDSQNHHPADAASPDDSSPQLSHLSSFFKIAYHRLLLLLSRPRLSLDQSTPEFQYGLQVCIRASRNILAGLKAHKSAGQSMFLPGLLSAAWMSGLIIAFACQLGKYPKARACADILACLSLLDSMNTRWYTVKNCHKVLSLLLANIQSRRASTNGVLAVAKSDPQTTASADDRDRYDARAPKRQRTSTSTTTRAEAPVVSNFTMDDFTLSPRGSVGGETPQSNTSSPQNTTMPPPVGNASHPAKLKTTPSAWSDTSLDNPGSGYDLSNFLNPHITHATNTTASSNSSKQRRSSTTHRRKDSSGSLPPPFRTIGSAVYSTPQEMAFAQSNMALPELPSNGSNVEDPMFWGNMDFNMADVFGSAAWESMTGMDPFPSNGTNWDSAQQTSGFGT